MFDEGKTHGPITYRSIEKGGDAFAWPFAVCSNDDLLAYPVPGSWSIQEIVIHLVDSDLILADRMKRIIAEDNPTLIGFDETQFTRNLHYNEAVGGRRR